MMKQDWRELLKCSIPEGETENWEVKRIEVTKEDAKKDRLFATIQGCRRFARAGTYTGLYRRGIPNPDPMMSDTWDELADHLMPLLEARGVCLVTGLGLGCIIQGMLEKQGENGNLVVDKVIVIEKEAEIIELVGTHLKKRYGDRLEIRHGDALTYKAPRGEKYDVVWHDIWPSICEDNLETMGTLHRKYGRRSNWQGSWQREQLQMLRRQSQRYNVGYGW